MCVCVRVRLCVRLFVCVCAYVQGGKKTRYFVMCLQFVVFNIFSHFLHHFVDEYQENLAYKFELCITRTLATAVSDSQKSAFKTNRQFTMLQRVHVCHIVPCVAVLAARAP